MTSSEREKRGLTLDHDKLRDLIGFYSRVEIRNIAEFGQDSAQAVAARRILQGLRDVTAP